MTPNGKLAFALAAGAVLYVTVAKPSLRLPGLELTAGSIFDLASDNNVQLFDGRLDPRMVTAIAFIESSFNPSAVRVEARIGDASVGLMQTLVGTAQWLYDSQGYRWRDRRPDFTSLFDPEASLYYGMAYLHWLTTKSGITAGRGEEVIVRAYNGGPGGADKSYTDGYWAKYRAAKAELF